MRDNLFTVPDKAAPEQVTDHRSHIEAETLALLFRQSAPGMYFALAIATLVAIGLWAEVATPALGLWLAAIGLSFLSRLALFVAYKRANPAGVAVLRWRMPYVATLYFSAAVWGLGLPWLMPADSIVHQAFVFVFLIGMASAALTTYSAVREIALITSAITMLPVVLWFLIQGDALRLAMGLGGLLFFVSAWRATRVLAAAMHGTIRLTHELETARASAEKAAQRDDLTGLFNRRALTELGSAAVARCRERNQPVSVMVFDLDHFKSINDTWGHATGDEALIVVANVLKSCLRQHDICGRLGGEEFGVVMPDTTTEAAHTIADRVRQAIAAEPLTDRDGPQHITASAGVASNGYDLETLLNQADQAMYDAKQHGRDRTVLAGS